MVWVRRDFKGHLVQAPALGRDTFHYTKFLKAPSSLWSKCCRRWGIHHFPGQPVPVFHLFHHIKSLLVSSWIYPVLSLKSVLSALMWMLWRGGRNSAHYLLWRVRKFLQHHTDTWRERVTEGDSTESKREKHCCCKGKGREKRKGNLCMSMDGRVTWSTREDKVVPCECAMCWAIRSHSYDCASPFLIACQLGFAVMELPLRKRFQFCSCTLNFVSTYLCFSCVLLMVTQCPFFPEQTCPIQLKWGPPFMHVNACTFGNIFQM